VLIILTNPPFKKKKKKKKIDFFMFITIKIYHINYLLTFGVAKKIEISFLNYYPASINKKRLSILTNHA